MSASASPAIVGGFNSACERSWSPCCSWESRRAGWRFSGGKRGWVGDNPFIFLDTAKIRATGWQPKLNIEQGIVRTLQWLQQNQWILSRR